MDTPTIQQDLLVHADQIIKKAVGSQARVESVFPWGGGARNVGYGICTQNPAGKFFLKIEKGAGLPRTRWGQIEREVNGIRLMQAAGVPCPCLVSFDASGDEIGRKYALVEFIEADLLWESWSQLDAADQAGLRQEITWVMDNMKLTHSPLYGDTYPGGMIGQHPTWQAACRSMGAVLLEDSLEMNMFTADQRCLVSETLEKGISCLVSDIPASFLHLDLGPHNVLATRRPQQGTGAQSPQGMRIAAVIDYGSSMFGPYYVEDNFRRYMGWNLVEMDVCAEYGLLKDELRIVELLWGLEFTLFAASICWGEYQKRIDDFIEQCRRI
jgi:hypothetical protein